MSGTGLSGGSLLGEIPALAAAYALSASETNAAMGEDRRLPDRRELRDPARLRAGGGEG